MLQSAERVADLSTPSPAAELNRMGVSWHTATEEAQIDVGETIVHMRTES